MKKGFTLIELLVVIAIIGILTAIITTNLVQSKSKSRDAKRVSDLAQLQLALELFFDRCNQYPVVSGGMPNLDDSSGCPSGVKLSTFISKIPSPPLEASYTYVVNDAVTPTDYILKAQLENPSSLDRFAGSKFGVSCGGSGTTDYCVVPR